jgi:hypothetical protein
VKRICQYIVVYLLMLIGYSTRSQPLPPAEVYPEICGNSGNYTYTYTNFVSGSHTSGFNVYRNGELIYNVFDGNTSSFACKGLYFFNESTGFMSIHNPYSGAHILKTTNYGATWTTAVFGWFYELGFYPVNEYCGYLVTYEYAGGGEPNTYTLKKFDLLSDTIQTLIEDDTLNLDTYFSDTLSGEPACFPLDSVSFTFGSGFTYYINVVMPEATSIEENTAVINPIVFPNPAQNSFKIANTPQHARAITLYTLTGQIIRTYSVNGLAQNSYDLTGLSNGLYILSVTADLKEYRYRIFVNN